jgi:uncharacterized membrane protein
MNITRHVITFVLAAACGILLGLFLGFAVDNSPALTAVALVLAGAIWLWITREKPRD